MKRKKFLLLIILLLFICVLGNIEKESKIYEKKDNLKKNILSIMLETSEGTGEYKLSSSSRWPTEGYRFNSELSRCENDSTLSWDSNKNAVVFHGNVSDKCYVYFDVNEKKTLVEYVLSKYTGVQGENNIYYHDSSLTNGALDNSYRYAGSSEEVNNFICFGSTTKPCPDNNLYRIIGVIDGKVKLIKYDYVTEELGTDGDYYSSFIPSTTYYKGNLTSINAYHWNYKSTNSITNTWSTSLLNKINLNTNFINYLGEKWKNKIATTTWKVGGNTASKIRDVIPSITYQNEIISSDTTNSTDNAPEYSAKIGLMYVSDYGFAADPSAWLLTLGNYNNTITTNYNWMYMGLNEWTISRSADGSGGVFQISDDGDVYNGNAADCYAVRPSFSLESFTPYISGLGSMNDPILITD